jgi:hypothetical protein
VGSVFGHRRCSIRLVCLAFVALCATGPLLAQSDFSTSPTPEVVSGGELVVPVLLNPADGVTSIDFSLLYDPTVLQATAVYKTTYTDGFSLITDLTVPGTVQVTLTGGAALIGNGPIVWIVFNAVGAAGTTSSLTWPSTSLNGGAISSSSTNGQVDVSAAIDALRASDTANGAPNMTVFVPVAADTINGWTDAAIELHYDAALLQALGVSSTPLTSGFTLGFDITQPGIVTATLSGGVGSIGSGDFLEILFRVNGSIGELTPLALVQATANGAPIPVDDGLFTICADADGDGHTECGDDCDDADGNTYPDAPETCDGLDNQCPGDAGHGVIDEGFDGDMDTYTSCGGDCNDMNPAISPAATETCDAIDNNCDSSVDEGFPDTDTDMIADCVDCEPLDPTNPQPPPVGDTLLIDKLAPGSSEAVLTWSDDGLAGPFRMYRGFRKAAMSPSYNAVCVGGPDFATTVNDALVPLLYSNFNYLVTRDRCGESIMGMDSTGSPIPNNDPCPSTGADADGDGTIEAIDTCPGLADPAQTDTDGDSYGDLCDNCITTFNPFQRNPDNDGLGDACDNCPSDDSADQTDTDADGHGDACDNCPLVPNVLQLDTNTDGVGDACSAPAPQATPAPLSFGNIEQAESAVLNVTLTNTGNAPMTVDSISLLAGTDAAFTIFAAPGVPELIPEGQNRIVTIQFAPTLLGVVSGTLRFGFSDASLADIDVTINGTGIEPIAPVALTVNPTSASRLVGECQQVRATAELSSGSFVDVTALANWNSSDMAIATVSTEGLVSVVGTGVATITAELDGFQDQSTITGVAAGTLRLAMPCGELLPGHMFDAEILVDAGAAALGSHAIRILYDPAVVRIVGLLGGNSAEFAVAPDANPADFNSGDTKIAAYQVAALATPTGVVSIGHVSFEVIGAAGSSTNINLVAETLVDTDLADIPWTNLPALLEIQP